jgi:hypothetical protein
MKQLELNTNQAQSHYINLDEILDPYERLRGDYYIVKITSAEYCDHRSLDKPQLIDPELIALEMIIVERCGDDISEKEKYKFQGKKLFLNISLNPKRVWLLKNLCNALNIFGTHALEELARLLIGRTVTARVSSRYDMDFDEYFHIINKFKRA